MARKTIFELEVANGNYPSAGMPLDFKQGLFSLLGVFGGASVAIQISGDSGTTWTNLRNAAGTDIALTAAVQDEWLQYLAAGDLIRGVISGATGTTALTLTIRN